MFELLTSPTPNGLKISIALEELGLPYQVRHIQLALGEQRTPEFLALNPNGRIPVLIDHDANDFVVFESGAILLYLAEKTGRLLPQDAMGRSRVLQWLMFQMGGVGPMMGQANVFARYAPERIEYAITRYQRECRRLFEVLNTQLAQHEFLAGEYSIADIANFAWVRSYKWSGLDIEGLTHLARWMNAIRERPAVQRGVLIPPREEASDEQRVAVAGKLLV